MIAELAVVALGAFATPRLEFGTKAIRISLSKGQSQRVPFYYRNPSQRPVVVWITTFYANRTVHLTDEAGRAVPMTALGRRQKASFDSGLTARDKNVPYTLRPGESLKDGTPPLGESFALKSGRYRLVVEYWERLMDPRLRMRTAPVTLTVVP